MVDLLLAALSAICVVWALSSWRSARRLSRENAWIRRRLSGEESASIEADRAARVESARRIRAEAVQDAAAYPQRALRLLDWANELERGGLSS